MFVKSDLKKSPEELREYLMFKRRGRSVPPKKGKGAKYNRSKAKREDD